MPQRSSLGPTFASRIRVAVALVVLGASIVGIAVLAVDVMRQINRQSSANSDNVLWSLSQVDVELLTLGTVLAAGDESPAALQTIRTRFDILFSRLTSFRVGSAFANLRNNPDFKDSFGLLRDFIHDTTPVMDGPDDALRQALPDLRARVGALVPVSHQIALKGLEFFARTSDERRNGVKDTLIKLALMIMVLVAALAVMLVRVLRLDRVNRQKASENAQALSRLDAVVSTALDAVIILNDYGQIVDFNPAAEQTFGYPKADVAGRALSLVIPLDDQGRSQLPPRHQPLNASQRRRRVTARHRAGHDFPAEVSLSTAQSGAGRVHVVYLRDLSQQVEAEQALVSARDEALAGEKAKADLLVVMSHEIRTPLNGMIGTIELLEGTPLLPHQREYLRIMATSGRFLMHHVNDVLDIARLDSGKASLKLTPVNLSDLVREVIENQTSASMVNGDTLNFSPAPDGRDLVLSDATMLQQVVMNLVGNAVKFTQNGTINIAVQHVSPRGPTEIFVEDAGIGILPEDISRIFEDFVTLDPSYARRAAGTGLGLGIVRRIVTRMGGKIDVESEYGRGTTFRVTVPMTILESARPQSAPASGAATSAGLSILVVEDNDFNRVIVTEMLLGENHRVTEARDGLEGVRLAAAQKFDVILMDISMPGIDGLQAAEQIRNGTGASSATPIVALTAHALREETERFRAGGMQSVLVKPITRDTLRSVLDGLPGQAPETVAEGLIDLDVLAALRSSLGPARAEKLLGKFLADTERRITDLTARAEDPGSEADLVSAVHRLSGSAAMFGATRLHARLSAIEDLCKRGDKDRARASIPEITALWASTAQAYRDLGSLAQASSLR